MQEIMEELRSCSLCEHRCGADRASGETGVCRMAAPMVASAALHPAPPESYTVFTAGCNFKCLHCQNWSISQYPGHGLATVRGRISPQELAGECVSGLGSLSARMMGADRIFFSGGEPTIHLPFIERTVAEAWKLEPGVKVNFDTNGYLTPKSLERVLAFATSITFDLKAYEEEVSLALTGASSGPVLANAEFLARHAPDRIWEYRITVIPGINEHQVRPLAGFLSDIDPELPVCFLAFRPNFVLEGHPGASARLMRDCVAAARARGLRNATYAGRTDIPGRFPEERELIPGDSSREARLAETYAQKAGCRSSPRECQDCSRNQDCPIKAYIPRKEA